MYPGHNGPLAHIWSALHDFYCNVNYAVLSLQFVVKQCILNDGRSARASFRFIVWLNVWGKTLLYIDISAVEVLLSLFRLVRVICQRHR